MKQPSRLTFSQKIVVGNNGLNCDEWALIKDLGADLRIINKETGEIKLVNKFKKKGRAK